MTSATDADRPPQPQIGSAAIERNEFHSIARGGALNLLGAGTSSVANVLLVVLVTRGFSKSAAGIFFDATSVFLLGARVAELGTTTGLVYFLSRFRALGERDRIGSCLRVAALPVLATAVAAGAVLFAFAPQVAAITVRGDPGHFTVFLRVLSVFLPMAAALDTVLAGTRGMGTMRPTVALDKTSRPIVQVMLTVLAVAVGSETLLTVAWVAPYLPAAVLAVLWMESLVRRSRRRGLDQPAKRPVRAAEFWRFTGPRALASVIQLALQRLDIILVAALRGPADAAIYTAATRFLVVGQLASQAIGAAVEPRLSRRFAKDDKAGVNGLYRTATAWLVLATWPMYLLCATFAPYVIRLFGHGYRSGTTVMVLLAATMLVATACGMVDMVLIMGGRTTWNLGNAALALVVNIGLDVVLIPRMGILGAAIGWGAAILVNNLVPLSQVALVLGLHPFNRATATATVLAGTCFGIIPLAVRVTLGSGPAPLATAAGVGLLLFIGGLWLRRDVLQLDALVALRPRRSSLSTRSVHWWRPRGVGRHQ